MFLLRNSVSDRFPNFSRPTIVGYFSVDGSRSISHDASQLQYYYPLSKLQNALNFDLNRGIEFVKRKPEDKDEKIDHVLQWIKKNWKTIRASPESQQWIQPDFVIFRGQLTKIMKSIYDFREGWIIRAVKFRGTIYMCSFETEEQKRENANLSKLHKSFMSWGFKFETYVLTTDPELPPDPSKPVDENEEFCCVFKSRLNDKIILYGAEMDGLYSTKKLLEPLPLKNLRFVELKTSKTIKNQHQKRILEKFKFLRWWCQSFLVGIEDILCGFRNDDGIVESIEQYKISEIGRRYKHYWSAGKCMNLLHDFLQFVKDNVHEDYDRKIYIFERIPFQDIKMTVASPDSEFAFLPSWFTET